MILFEGYTTVWSRLPSRNWWICAIEFEMYNFQKKCEHIFTLDSSIFDEEIVAGKMQQVCNAFFKYIFFLKKIILSNGSIHSS